MKPESAGKTHELHSVLEALFIEQGFEHKIVEQKIFAAWERVVGGPIARNTQPVSLIKAKLTVHASSHPLVTELTFQREHIIRKLNAEVGRAAVGELRFQFKPFSPRQELKRYSRFERHKVAEKNLRDTPASADVLEKIERTLQDVHDAELKTNLQRLFISQNRRTVSDNRNRVFS